ncbi:MAG: M23 family metallopeptidase [Patescibacteria group bacterium]
MKILIYLFYLFCFTQPSYQQIAATIKTPEKITIEPETIEQGGLMTIQIPKDSNLTKVEIICGHDTLVLIEQNNNWVALWAPDLEAETGRYKFKIILEKTDCHKQTLYRTIFVKKIKAPIKKITLSPRFIKIDSIILERIKREKARLSRALSWAYQSKTEIAWTRSFILPLDSAVVSSQFGEKRIFTGKILSVHNGVDLSAPGGDSVRAVNDGKIVLIGDFFFEGKLVIIDHGGKLFTVYCHLSKILVAENQMVKRGQIIGLVGSTGRSTGPHLHWGARLGQARINPLELLRLPILKRGADN